MVWSTKYDGQESTILPEDTSVEGQQGAGLAATTDVDYMSRMNILSRAARLRLSGIVCTIGPASKATDFLAEMMDTGLNIARLNFSHGSYEYHGETIKNVRAAVEKVAEAQGFHPNVAIALDTKGPEIRSGILEGDDGRKEVALEKGAAIKITTDESFKEKCSKDVLYVDYKNITNVMEVGKRIFIDDGLISVVAKEIGDDFVLGEIENGGNLGSRKGCNLPGTDTDLPAVSEKDKKDLEFGVEQGVDMVFASFIRNAAGVKEIRDVLGEKGKHILIIPKIENQQGVNNIDEIIEASDGIMVARGDMGIEIPPEKVFIAQKQMIAKCNQAGKPVICATQMLESMVKKPRPTRAEASDVANAILDGADCVMLSGETAKGDYPLNCIHIMASLCREAEACVWNERVFNDMLAATKSGASDASTSVAISAVQMSLVSKASAIVVLTNSGRTAKLVSKFRPKVPIVAVTRDAQVARQLQLHRGILPLNYVADKADFDKETEARVKKAVELGTSNGFLSKGDNVVVVSGAKAGSGANNAVKLLLVD